MKILLSAYACEPDKGSEPFLGWRWAREIAQHHETWVITKENNKTSIEKYLNIYPIPNIHFSYVDVKGLVKKYKKGHRGMQIYYYFWQKAAYKRAMELHDEIHFDIVHHLTFGAFTQPTFLWKLGVPFVWGPIGGGEKLPDIPGRKLDIRSRIYELLRNIQMNVYNYFPFTKGALQHASKILVATEETYNLIPRAFHNKCELFQSLGIDRDFIRKGKLNFEKSDRIKILVVGRMIGWKGFDIAIDVFKRIADKYENVDLYLRGRGELRDSLLQRCGSLLDKRIFYIKTYFDYEDMHDFYANNDIFLNCSLHDSGCLVILEAMSAGLPIVCIDTGGPHVITSDANAFKIKPAPYVILLDSIENALEKLINDKKLRNQMGEESRKVIEKQYLYEVKYNHIDEIYKYVASIKNETLSL